VRLKIHTAQKYLHSIRIRILHLTLKNTVELLEAALVYHHFIAGFEIRARFHKTIRSNSRSNQTYDLLINRRWSVVETHQAVDATSKSYSVIQVVESKTREDIAGEQWLNNTTQLTGELIALINLQLGIESFYSPCLQVAVSAFFLLVMSADNVPGKRVFNWSCHGRDAFVFH